jgi:hypothetical protein
MEYLTENNLQMIILYVAPGFISLKIWALIQPSRKTALSESIMEAIVFSSFNYIATAWVFFLLRLAGITWLYYLIYFIVLIVCPVMWPVLLRRLLTSKVLRNKIISPIPKAWDYFFSKRDRCFILVHLNNERIIGGFYGLDSFASSYPEKEDLYLEEVWKVDSAGKILDKITDTKGLLINHDVIEYIELFDIREGE